MLECHLHTRPQYVLAREKFWCSKYKLILKYVMNLGVQLGVSLYYSKKSYKWNVILFHLWVQSLGPVWFFIFLFFLLLFFLSLITLHSIFVTLHSSLIVHHSSLKIPQLPTPYTLPVWHTFSTFHHSIFLLFVGLISEHHVRHSC